MFRSWQVTAPIAKVQKWDTLPKIIILKHQKALAKLWTRETKILDGKNISEWIDNQIINSYYFFLLGTFANSEFFCRSREPFLKERKSIPYFAVAWEQETQFENLRTLKCMVIFPKRYLLSSSTIWASGTLSQELIKKQSKISYSDRGASEAKVWQGRWQPQARD